MAARPRTVDDGAILEATLREISRVGPARMTLAGVGKEAGLSAAALVQRFGSKRGLLLTLVRWARDTVDECFVRVRAAHRSPAAALVAAATEVTQYVGSPEEMANHLAFLQNDLSDPDFHQIALENATRIHAGYVALIDDAVAAGELIRCDTARLASAIDAMAGGSIIAWAIHRRGTAKAWVTRDMETLLAPYRRQARGRTGTAARRRPRG